MVQPAAVREPLKLKPILQSRIWGGEGLYRLLGKGFPGPKDVGESWELSDREGNANIVAGGTFAGRELRELFSLHARDILGTQYSPSHARFPLLHKFIYARENLSVQVHPSEDSPLGEAKSECWYIVDAPRDASLIVGLSKDGPKEEILAALESRDCQTVLNRVPARPGDLFYIPAGTVHAITAGILLYEVQQNSDTTFRLYDWDRLDPSGKPRQLHLEESAKVIDFRRHDRHRIRPLALSGAGRHVEFLVATRHFAVARFTGCAEAEALDNRGRFRVLTCIKGGFEITWETGQPVSLGLGETALIPAACPGPRLRETEPGSEVLVSFLPLLEQEVVAPLRASGHGREDISALGGIDGIPV